MELTVSGFLIGFSLGQLLWGPLGDRYGRRLPVAAGLLLFLLGSAGCAISGTSTGMICWRIVQAVGACSGVVLSRAMVRDLYEGSRAAQMLSTLITVGLLHFAAAGVALCGVVLAVTWYTGWGGLVGLAVPLFVFVSWSGLIVANSIVGAMQDFPARAGSVSALVGALHYGSGILGSAAVSTFANGTPSPLAIVVAVANFGSFASLALLPRSKG